MWNSVKKPHPITLFKTDALFGIFVTVTVQDIQMLCKINLSNNVLPYKRVCDKEDLVTSSNVGSILFKVLRRVYCS